MDASSEQIRRVIEGLGAFASFGTDPELWETLRRPVDW
jgi:hypothetical protein